MVRGEVMRRLSTLVAAAAVVGLVGPLAHASGQTVPARMADPVMGPLARVGTGSIRGLVLDGGGLPVMGAMVSALGSTAAFTLTDRDGRFLMKALPPGAYTVRVHLEGYVPSRREIVEVRSMVPSVLSVALQAIHPGPAPGGPPVLAAGLMPVEFRGTGRGNGASDPITGSDTDENTSEVAWRLRHLKRSIFRDIDTDLILAGNTGPGEAASTPSTSVSPTRRLLASSLFSGYPFSGQLNFITSGSLDATSKSPSLGTQNVAYVALGAPVGRLADWSVRGAYTQGDVASWFVAGSLAARRSSVHRFAAGASYSAQEYDRVDPLAFATIAGGARAVGAIYAFDDWAVSKNVALSLGANYAWYDYLPGSGLFSPRVSLTLSPVDGFRVRTLFSHHESAPGAEEFLPPAGGPDGYAMWLPPERTFSTLSPRTAFKPEQTSHYEVSVERDIDSFVVGFRAFYQQVQDQMAALFASSPFAPAAGLGHYYVAGVGDMEATGWAVSVSRPLVGPVRGSVDYSLTTATWRPVADAEAIAWTATPLRRTEQERFHDVTTTVETTIPRTATRLYVLYKLNSVPVRSLDPAGRNSLDGRFEIQINQGLPFLNFTSAEWELLVAVRNLFRDSLTERSAYDEMLVIRPPKRIVGGVRVRF